MADASPNSHSKQHIRVLRSSAETRGKEVQLEATYAPHSPRPPEHFHPNQHESFEILQGEFVACVGGELRTYRPGDRFEIPARVPHWMHNVAAGPGKLLWRIRPTLRSQEMHETFFGMADQAQRTWKLRRILKLAALLYEYRAEMVFTKPPAWVQWPLIHIVGRLAARKSSPR